MLFKCFKSINCFMCTIYLNSTHRHFNKYHCMYVPLFRFVFNYSQNIL